MFNINFSKERLEELEILHKADLQKAKGNMRYMPEGEQWMTMDDIQNPKLKQFMLEVGMAEYTTDSSDDIGLLQNLPYILKYSTKAINFTDEEWSYVMGIIHDLNMNTFIKNGSGY